AGDRKGSAAEIHVQILDLRCPIGREADFHTEASRPAHTRFAFLKADQIRREIAVGETSGAVKQYIVHCIANAAVCQTTDWRIATARMCRLLRSPECLSQRRRQIVQLASCIRFGPPPAMPLGFPLKLLTEPHWYPRLRPA